jgi:hypothetical protein
VSVKYFLETFVWSYLNLGLVVIALYLVTLHRALRACRPSNRVMPPWLVWLQLLPCVFLVWQFVNVIAVDRSLRREFQSRGVASDIRLETLGLVTCTLITLTVVVSVISDAGEGLGGPDSISRWWTALNWFGVATGIAGLLAAFLLWTGMSAKKDELLKLDRPVIDPAPDGSAAPVR